MRTAASSASRETLNATPAARPRRVNVHGSLGTQQVSRRRISFTAACATAGRRRSRRQPDRVADDAPLTAGGARFTVAIRSASPGLRIAAATAAAGRTSASRPAKAAPTASANDRHREAGDARHPADWPMIAGRSTSASTPSTQQQHVAHARRGGSSFAASAGRQARSARPAPAAAAARRTPGGRCRTASP